MSDDIADDLDGVSPVDLMDAILRNILPEGHEIDEATPMRHVLALNEMLSGYEEDITELMMFTPSDGYDQIVAVKDIPFVSLCEHHVLPMIGTAAVAYLPRGQLIGLSKIPRVVKALTKRLQLQERITKQIADAMSHAAPLGTLVVVEAQHICMCGRGVESPGKMVTSYADGVFREHGAARDEALRMMGR